MAMDIPLPVTGGIMVRASPIFTPRRSVACLGERERAAIELKEESSHWALCNRWERRELASPLSHSFHFEARSEIG